ncbi:GIY-YIG nuclease family protein [Shewanella sp. NKUCC05_KAH]|uniref:GIY-YIG nuclease family protein n=1 Tax=Shewanella sp. NKUCC05_KAH TaxID=2842126 RepID=UPI001C5AB199|nr:GIY-YIG nuclease family protein [Shewanella sp. NKUCC05_KAH]MBW3528643.1 GIY-YIG nuclease family protein [Shewanella sp. NKUCC05_KAH]
MLRKLTNIGFRKVGVWSLTYGEPDLEIQAEAESSNILYSFVVDGIPKYVGKTVQPLKKRMYGYRKPAATQSTNIRNNNNIKSALQNGSVIELYVLPDHGLLHFGAFHLNLAAGLEDSIVSLLSPEWNFVGK